MGNGKTNCGECGRPIKKPDFSDVPDRYLWQEVVKTPYCRRCYKKLFSEWKKGKQKFEAELENATMPCRACKGIGKIKGYKCQTCSGKGKVKKSSFDLNSSEQMSRTIYNMGFNGIECENA